MSTQDLTVTTSFATRVRAGVALLDAKEPGWHEQVNADRLNIDSRKACVLGQLHGSFSEGATEVLGLNRGPFKAVNFGFDALFDRARAIRTLNRLWVYVVRTRQAVSQ